MKKKKKKKEKEIVVKKIMDALLLQYHTRLLCKVLVPRAVAEVKERNLDK